MRPVAIAAMALSGCTMATETRPEPVSSEKCDIAPVQPLVGRAADEALAREILRLSGARTLRWKPPGTVVTMDYRPDRVNVSLDTAGKITGFDCG